MNKKAIPRIPRNYDGSNPTGRHVKELLPAVLNKIGENYQERPDLILAAWPEIIGPILASQTQAVSFIDGKLTVKVKNSTLYSLLNQNDKPKLVATLRQRFPRIEIKTILFRIG